MRWKETDDTGIRLPEEGWHNAHIVDCVIDETFEDSQGRIGLNIVLTWELDSGVRISYDRYTMTTPYGRYLAMQMFDAIDLPYDVPDPNDISKRTGRPRKEYFIERENFIGRPAKIKIIHVWKCPVCGHYVPRRLDTCPDCSHGVQEENEIFYPEVDRDGVLPWEEGKIIEVKAPSEKDEDEDLPEWLKDA